MAFCLLQLLGEFCCRLGYVMDGAAPFKQWLLSYKAYANYVI